jgi:hypothetical protein
VSPDDPETQRDHELGERYLRGELDEPQREAFERRLLEDDALFEDVRALELAREALAPASAASAAAPAGPRRGVPGWLGWAAALLLALPAASWLRERVSARAPVTRAPGDASTAVPVEAVVELDAATAALPRARVLIGLPSPELSVGDVLRAELRGPRGERPAEGLELRPASGRVRLVVDARELAPGPWRLELTWSDAAGRARGQRSYELRLQ